jgi:hypothetical protein
MQSRIGGVKKPSTICGVFICLLLLLVTLGWCKLTLQVGYWDGLLLGLQFTTLLVFSSILEITILCPDLLVFWRTSSCGLAKWCVPRPSKYLDGGIYYTHDDLDFYRSSRYLGGCRGQGWGHLESQINTCPSPRNIYVELGLSSQPLILNTPHKPGLRFRIIDWGGFDIRGMGLLQLVTETPFTVL